MSLCLDSFLCMRILCLLPYIIRCIIVTWWGGPGGIEAWSLGPLLPSVRWHCWLGRLTHKNPSLIWPLMCLVGCWTLFNQSSYGVTKNGATSKQSVLAIAKTHWFIMAATKTKSEHGSIFDHLLVTTHVLCDTKGKNDTVAADNNLDFYQC